MSRLSRVHAFAINHSDRYATRWSQWTADTRAFAYHANRGVLDDNPRLTSILQHEVKAGLEATYPWPWHAREGVWHLRNAWRGFRGRPALPQTWRDDPVSVSVNTEDRDYFERNIVVILAEQHRRWGRVRAG